MIHQTKRPSSSTNQDLARLGLRFEPFDERFLSGARTSDSGQSGNTLIELHRGLMRGELTEKISLRRSGAGIEGLRRGLVESDPRVRIGLQEPDVHRLLGDGHELILIRGVVGAQNKKPKLDIADLENIVSGKLALADLLAVHISAVRRAQVFDREVHAGAANNRALTRRLLIVKNDVATFFVPSI